MICFRQTRRSAFAALLLVGVFACPLSLVAGKGNGNGGGGNGGGGGGEDPPPEPPIAFSIDFLPVDHFALGMNDLGDISGFGPGPVLEFIWLSDGTLIYETEFIAEEDVVPGQVWNLWHFEDINNFGQIAVTALRRDGSAMAVFRLTLGDGETPTLVEHIGDFSQGEIKPETWAWDINDNGDIVGGATFPDPSGDRGNFGIGGLGFLFSDESGLIDVGTFGGASLATAVSESREIVGYSYDLGVSDWRAFRTTVGGSFENLGTLSNRRTDVRGLGLNDVGGVVGLGTVMSRGSIVEHAFLYTDATGMIDLGTLGSDSFSSANDINNQGVIVGQSGGSFNGGFGVATLFIDGALYRLSDLVVDLPVDCELVVETGDSLTHPIRINEFNEICGTALFSDGTMAGCRLTPLP